MVAGKKLRSSDYKGQSAACNSVVLAAASDRHKNYSALRGYPLREKNGCRSSRKCGCSNAKIRITFFRNQHFKNDDSAHELSLKSELKSMRLSSTLTRTKMSRFNILLSGKCSTNISRQQATFQSGSCKSNYIAVSMSATTKTTKSNEIQIWGFT